MYKHVKIYNNNGAKLHYYLTYMEINSKKPWITQNFARLLLFDQNLKKYVKYIENYYIIIYN